MFHFEFMSSLIHHWKVPWKRPPSLRWGQWSSTLPREGPGVPPPSPRPLTVTQPRITTTTTGRTWSGVAGLSQGRTTLHSLVPRGQGRFGTTEDNSCCLTPFSFLQDDDWRHQFKGLDEWPQQSDGKFSQKSGKISDTWKCGIEQKEMKKRGKGIFQRHVSNNTTGDADHGSPISSPQHSKMGVVITSSRQAHRRWVRGVRDGRVICLEQLWASIVSSFASVPVVRSSDILRSSRAGWLPDFDNCREDRNVDVATMHLDPNLFLLRNQLNETYFACNLWEMSSDF